jgi:carboxyl-terminal processing protease
LDVEVWKHGEIAVLRITAFRGGRTRTALETTLNMVSNDAARIVIDLRYAGGGDLFEAIDAAALLVERGSLLGVLHGREGDPRPVYSVIHSRPRPPVVMFVGPDTASAGEIFAGILQFHQRSVLIGRPTFGKCSSQTERSLRDGSVLRFTNLEFRFPDGSTCSGVGLKPDVEVDQDVFGSLDSLLDEVKGLPFDVPEPVDDRGGL